MFRETSIENLIGENPAINELYKFFCITTKPELSTVKTNER